MPIKSNLISKRRLSCIADYEGKTRVIALGDIGSQTVLKPLHDFIMKLLKDVKPDLTYNHDKCVKRVKRYWVNKFKHKFNPYSIDLTAATDRLPASTMAIVLSYITENESLGKA